MNKKKIGVYATHSKNTYNQSHIYNSQTSGCGFNYINYKDQKKPNINNTININKNLIKEQFSFSGNSPYHNKVMK